MNEKEIPETQGLNSEEETSPFFIVRLVRLALYLAFIIGVIVLPGFAAWKSWVASFEGGPFFWTNLGWFLLNEIYLCGGVVLIYGLTYLFGGTKGFKSIIGDLLGRETTQWVSETFYSFALGLGLYSILTPLGIFAVYWYKVLFK
jgi:hypothetical protein